MSEGDVADMSSEELLYFLADEAQDYRLRVTGEPTAPVKLAYLELGRRLGTWKPHCWCGRQMNEVRTDEVLEGWVCPKGHASREAGSTDIGQSKHLRR